MTLISTKKDKTKEKIINCFWVLYRKKGLDKITVSELTELAKINRSTFYAHFKDIYDVLDEIEESYLPGGTKFLVKCSNLTTADEVHAIFQQIFENNCDNFAFLLSAQGDPNFATKLKNRTIPIFTQHVPEIYQKSKFFDLTVDYVLTSLLGAISYWVNHRDEISSDELFHHLHDLYLHGIPYCLKEEIQK